MSTIKTSTASRVAGALLALTGILGVIVLGLDRVLWESLGGTHAYGLMVFVIIDFALAAFIVAKPTRTAFTLIAAWSALRIGIQFADLYFAPALGSTYADFAAYLFNPAVNDPHNPPGIPGAPVDLILILEIIVIWAAWFGRKSVQK